MGRWALLFAGIAMSCALSGCSSCGGRRAAQEDAGESRASSLPDEPAVEGAFEGVIEADILTPRGTAAATDNRMHYAFTVRGHSVRWDLPNQATGTPRRIGSTARASDAS